MLLVITCHHSSVSLQRPKLAYNNSYHWIAIAEQPGAELTDAEGDGNELYRGRGCAVELGEWLSTSTDL